MMLRKFGFKKHEPRESDARLKLQKELFAHNRVSGCSFSSLPAGKSRLAGSHGTRPVAIEFTSVGLASLNYCTQTEWPSTWHATGDRSNVVKPRCCSALPPSVFMPRRVSVYAKRTLLGCYSQVLVWKIVNKWLSIKETKQKNIVI